MIERDMRQREVMVISDFPLEKEQQRGVQYSEPSQTTFKDALNTASFNTCKNTPTKHLLNSLTICYTYLSVARYNKGDFDWAKSIVSKRQIPEGLHYYQVPWLKDIWVCSDIWYELQDLLAQIKEVQPKIIVCAGKWSFLFLAVNPNHSEVQLTTIAATKGKFDDKKMFGALNKYRSSILTLNSLLGVGQPIVYPILTPSFLFLVKDKQFVVNRDYNKLARLYRAVQEGTKVEELLYSKRISLLGINKSEVTQYLNAMVLLLEGNELMVAMDVETRQGYIDCIGICYNSYESLTIPFSYMSEEINDVVDLTGVKYISYKETEVSIPVGATVTKYRNFWSLQAELEIQELLWRVMLHPNCKHVGQNYNYDAQFYYHQWKLQIYSHCDTMVLHHVLHNTMQKDLAMLASLYCDDYIYWKSEIDIKDNETRWKYNGKDCCYTLSIAKLLLNIIEVMPGSLQEFYHFQQFDVVPTVVNTMNRGILIDIEQKDRLHAQFLELMYGCIEKINYVFNEEVNLNSSPQVKRAFKDLLGIKPVLNRKTKRESFGSDAMLVYLEQYPEWRTLLTLFLEYKSIKVFVRNFLSAKVDVDGKMRCDYNPAGTKSYRLSSRKNVFGNGCVPITRAEAYTPNGWVSISEKPPIIMQYTDTGTLEFVPVSWYFTEFTGELYSYSSRCFKGDFTPEHRIVYQGHREVKSRSRNCNARPAREIANLFQAYIPVCGKYAGNNNINVSDSWLQMLVLLSADGSLESSGLLWRVGFKKDRKKDRLFAILDYYTESNHYERKENREDYIRYIIEDNNYTKVFPKWLVHLSFDQRKLFIEELQHWDGHICNKKGIPTGSFNYYTTIPENAYLVQTIAHLTDYSASLTIDLTNSNEHGNTSTKPLYTVCVSTKIVNTSESKRWTTIHYEGIVGCPITPSTMWLMRYDSEIHITGNTNLANIPSKGKLDLRIALQELNTYDEEGNEVEAEDTDILTFTGEDNTLYEGTLQLPNVKKIFLPSSNEWTFFDADYSAIDLHFVVWESDCKFLKDIIKQGKDVYSVLASHYYQKDIIKVDEERQIFKSVCHGANYIGTAPTLAAKAGLNIVQVRKVLSWYFNECPEIPAWHKRVENQCRKFHWIENVFGARFECFDFNDPMWINKMVAVIGQSSSSVLVNEAWVALERAEQGKNIQVLLQTHDSLSGQFRTSDITAVQRIKAYMEIPVPYKDVLIIPAQIKTSRISYGDCK